MKVPLRGVCTLHGAWGSIGRTRRLEWCERGFHYVCMYTGGTCECGAWMWDKGKSRTPKFITTQGGEQGQPRKVPSTYGETSPHHLNQKTNQLDQKEESEKMSILSEWKTTTGMKDHFTFTVDKGEFAYDEKYMKGEALFLKLTGKDDEDGDEVEVTWPTGKGWERKDKAGRYCHNPEHPKTFFQDRSIYGIVIDLCCMPTDAVHPQGIQGFGMGPLLEKRDMSPKDAHCFVGMKFECKRHKMNFGTRNVKGAYNEKTGEFDPDTKVSIESERLMPIAFLGCESEPGWEEGTPGADVKAGGGKGKADAKPKANATTSKKKTTAKATTKAADPEPDDGVGVDEDEADTTPAPKETAAEKMRRERAEKKAAEAKAAAGGDDDDTNEHGPILTSLESKFPGISDVIKEAFSKSKKDFDTWMDVIMEYPEIEGNDEVLTTCGDPDLLWAELAA